MIEAMQRRGGRAGGAFNPRLTTKTRDLSGSCSLSVTDRFDFAQDELLLTVCNAAGGDVAHLQILDAHQPSASMDAFSLPPGEQVELIRTADPYDLRLLGPDGFCRRFSGCLAEDGPVAARLKEPRRGRGLILEIVPAEDAWFCVNDETGLCPTRRYRLSAGAPLRLRLPVLPDGAYDLTVSRLGGAFSRRFAGRLASQDPLRSCG